jgi:hypothetical protein
MIMNMRVRDGQKVVVQGVNRIGGEIVPVPINRAVLLMNAGLLESAESEMYIKTHVDLCLKQAKGGNPPEIAKSGDVVKVSGNQAVKLIAGGKAETASAPAIRKTMTAPEKPKKEKGEK